MIVLFFFLKRRLYLTIRCFKNWRARAPLERPPWDESNKRSRDCVKTHSGDRPFPGDNGVIKTTHAPPSLKRAERNYCNVKWKRWRGERRYHESVKALRQFKGTVKKKSWFLLHYSFPFSISYTPQFINLLKDVAAYKVLETHQIIKHSSEVFAAFFDVRAFINLVTADPSATSSPLILNSQELPFESVQNVQTVDADGVLVLLQLPKLSQTKPVFSLIAEGAENEFGRRRLLPQDLHPRQAPMAQLPR